MTTATTAPSRTAPLAATAQATAPDLGLLVLRVGFGALLAVHGTQKLFGWFGGSGLSATAQGFAAMGYDPSKFFATLAGLSELGGGLLLALGLLTPLGAAIALGTMINAIDATRALGFDTGWQLALVYAIAVAALAFTGPGRFALDHGRPWQRSGWAWSVGAIVLGVVGAIITLIAK